MKLAISNIAWTPAEDALAAGLLHEHGITGIEVAPTVVWERPLEVDETTARAYRERWAKRGITIVALQSLLYGRPDLRLFGSRAVRKEFVEYLTRVFRLASWLGAGPLVFGSPSNRRAEGMDPEQRRHTAITTFRELGDRAAELGVVLCLEPNPIEYGCDFVTTAEEGAAMVRSVNSPGFGLHLDAGAMTLAGEDPFASLIASRGLLRHFHASEPNLATLGSGQVPHPRLAEMLRAVGYTGWVSLEMRRDESVRREAQLGSALRSLRLAYARRADAPPITGA